MILLLTNLVIQYSDGRSQLVLVAADNDLR